MLDASMGAEGVGDVDDATHAIDCGNGQTGAELSGGGGGGGNGGPLVDRQTLPPPKFLTNPGEPEPELEFELGLKPTAGKLHCCHGSAVGYVEEQELSNPEQQYLNMPQKQGIRSQ